MKRSLSRSEEKCKGLSIQAETEQRFNTSPHVRKSFKIPQAAQRRSPTGVAFCETPEGLSNQALQ
jgi:hypothetical protein